MRLRIALAAGLTACSLLLVSHSFTVPSRAADTIPSRLSDAEFWKMVTDFSEPDGYFQLEIVTSNETSYQQAMPQLIKMAKSDGAYLGVGPEQNFTYLAALQPKI